MSNKRKWMLGLIAALLLAMLGYAIAGPYLAINGIRRLVAANQPNELWRYVDFEQLRDSVRPQLQERIAQGILARGGGGQAGRAIGEVTAMLAAPAIDALSSPQGISILLTGTSLRNRLLSKPDASGKLPAFDPLQDARTRFESPSLFTATVDNAEGQPVAFEFRRSGLGWKLAGIRLPKD